VGVGDGLGAVVVGLGDGVVGVGLGVVDVGEGELVVGLGEGVPDGDGLGVAIGLDTSMHPLSQFFAFVVRPVVPAALRSTHHWCRSSPDRPAGSTMSAGAAASCVGRVARDSETAPIARTRAAMRAASARRLLFGAWRGMYLSTVTPLLHHQPPNAAGAV
jgi:hypothetical protein